MIQSGKIPSSTITDNQLPSKYFVCNTCNSWNFIEPTDGFKKSKKDPNRETVDIHMVIDKRLYIMFKQFCTNFGNYEAGIAYLMNEFNKKHG